MIQLLLFVILSAGIVRFSWAPLHDKSAHGFYRFFAFEAILALVLLNAEHWFRDPFSGLQIASWLLIIVSLCLAIPGFYLLGTVGRPSGSFENTSTLVRSGLYRYIRHPLYSSLLWFAWAVFLKDPSTAGIILAMTATAALCATARVEEAENGYKFGDAYTAYVRTTKMFVPFVF